jgi:uncharacterized membrane protein
MKTKRNWFITITVIFSVLFIIRISTAPHTRSTKEIVKDQEGTWNSIDRYLSYGSFIYGKYGFDPYRDNSTFYNNNTSPENDISRARDARFKTIGIGFINTIFMTPGSDKDLINEIEKIKATYGSTRVGATGARANSIIDSGFTIGAFICCFIIPVICWIVYLVQLSNIKSAKKREANSLENEKQRQLNSILNSKETEIEYKEKLEALNKLKEVNGLSMDEYNEKANSLREMLYSKIVEEKSILQSKEKQQALEEALKKGVITEEEYEQKRNKISNFEKSNESKLKLDKTACPVCKASLSPEDNNCIRCGLQIRQ